MIKILNNNLTVINRHRDNRYNVSNKFSKTLYNLGVKKYELAYGGSECSLSNSGIIGLLSYAYTNHLSVNISPDDIWTLIVSQIAQIVKTYSEDYRSLFTESDKKETICVLDSDNITVSNFSNVVSSLIKFDSNLIIPTFTTTNEKNTELYSAALCDIASPYYDYMVYMCGIRKLKIEGTIEDWNLMYNNVTKLAEILDSKANIMKVHQYFQRVKDIILKFINHDTTNWLDIFTQKNLGSGRDLAVNGWIIDLIFDIPSLLKINNLTNFYSVVQYYSQTSKSDYIAIWAGLDYDNILIDSEYFIKLKYNKYIFKKLD